MGKRKGGGDRGNSVVQTREMKMFKADQRDEVC
jgi:hypothetical protein